MKKNKKPLKNSSFILLVLLLAVICIAFVELAVCSYQSPELYHRLTDPIRTGVQQLAQRGQAAWEGWRGSFSAAVRTAAQEIRGSLDELVLLAEESDGDSEDLEDIQLVDGEILAPPPRPQADFAVTALAARSGVEYLTGGTQEILYYNQTADRWSNEPYGSDKIGGYGCGPTAMAMVVSTLTSTTVDPAQMARHCVDQGYWAKKHGSYRSIIAGVSEDYGLNCTPLPPEETDLSTISRCLSDGQLVVALMGPGHFTSRGHFILLRGVTLDGSILVADPASVERSLTTWDLELILSELSASRDSGGPLWLVSAQDFV